MTLIFQVQIGVTTTELKVILLNTIDYYITIERVTWNFTEKLEAPCVDMQVPRKDMKTLTWTFDVPKKNADIQIWDLFRTLTYVQKRSYFFHCHVTLKSNILQIFNLEVEILGLEVGLLDVECIKPGGLISKIKMLISRVNLPISDTIYGMCKSLFNLQLVFAILITVSMILLTL